MGTWPDDLAQRPSTATDLDVRFLFPLPLTLCPGKEEVVGWGLEAGRGQEVLPHSCPRSLTKGPSSDVLCMDEVEPNQVRDREPPSPRTA